MTTGDRARRKIAEGRDLLNRDYTEGAIQAFTEAIKLDPELAEAYEARAIAYDGLGRDKEAEADRDKAKDIRWFQTKATEPKGFGKYFAFTAIPIVVLSLISTGGAAVDGLYSLWYIAAVIGAFALLGAVISFAVGERKKASGLLAGVAIGILSLATTCFANMATFDI